MSEDMKEEMKRLKEELAELKEKITEATERRRRKGRGICMDIGHLLRIQVDNV